jgi:hypothetical protein
MNVTKQIAEQLRAVYFGGNWTAVNFKEQLADVTWQQATAQVSTFNPIATLVFHTNYYVNAVTQVLRGNPINAKDAYSFDHPPIDSQEAWESLLNQTWTGIENFAVLVEGLPGEMLWQTFAKEKYGNYYRNLHGIIEHAHYHLGQIVLIKKMILQGSNN